MSLLKAKIFLSKISDAVWNNLALFFIIAFFVIGYLIPTLPKFNNPNLNLLFMCGMADILFGSIIMAGVIAIIRREAPIAKAPINGIWVIFTGLIFILPGLWLIAMMTLKTVEKLWIP